MHDIVIFRNVLWDNILKVPSFQYFNSYFLFLMLGSIVLVFTVFSLIDVLRISIIESKMLAAFDKIVTWFWKIN